MNIIGGPAVRRADTREVFVWLVLDARAARIDGQVRLSPKGKIIGTCSRLGRRPEQLGDRLFVYMLRLVPDADSFPTERKLYYDIEIDGQRLADFGLVTGNKRIVYGSDVLPSFFLPEKHRDVLQGSCRKPHAGTRDQPQHDQLVEADRLTGRLVNDLRKRPSLLLLTGDQIYADDVATPLLAALRGQAARLTGWQETLPPKRKRPVEPHKIKLLKRGRTLNQRGTGFSSAQKDNHLMSFGEYMAMYLAVWGGLPLSLPSYADIRDDITTKTIKSGRLKRQLRVLSRVRYQHEATRVEHFLDQAWRVRRLMANTPTCMIFDDHEVTDDWNLTAPLADKLRNVALSRRIVANALAAYWACQGWGNDPKSFDKAWRATVADFLTSKSHRGGREFDAAMRRRYWGYTLDGYPAVVVLDTRTKRAFPRKGPPALMDEAHLTELGEEFARLASKYVGEDGQSIILVSAAPVYGFKAIELVQLRFAKSKAEKVDAESWFGNPAAFARLHRALQNVFTEHCLIFSGDVHYAFNREERIRSGAFNNATTLTQLTSSALCNKPEGASKLGLKILQKLSKMREFNRFQARYLWPAEDDKHFINGHPNLGWLQLEDGKPTRYQLVCRNPDDAKAYRWTYILSRPEIVHFDSR